MIKLTPIVLVVCAACSALNLELPRIDRGVPATAVPVPTKGLFEEEPPGAHVPKMLL